MRYNLFHWQLLQKGIKKEITNVSNNVQKYFNVLTERMQIDTNIVRKKMMKSQKTTTNSIK